MEESKGMVPGEGVVDVSDTWTPLEVFDQIEFTPWCQHILWLWMLRLILHSGLEKEKIVTDPYTLGQSWKFYEADLYTLG